MHFSTAYHIHIRKLQGVLNTAARMIYKKGKFDHITPVLRELHWLPIKERIVHKILTTTCNIRHYAEGPPYLKDTVGPYNQGQKLRSKYLDRLDDPKTNHMETGPSLRLVQSNGTSYLLKSGIPQAISSSEND